MSRLPYYIGAVAFTRSGYPNLGWCEHAEMLRRFGSVRPSAMPRDLSEPTRRVFSFQKKRPQRRGEAGAEGWKCRE
jgi:hypothetical protein